MNPFELAWSIWLGIWFVLWAWSKRSRRREKAGTLLLHALPIALAVYLFEGRHLPVPLYAQVVPYRHALYGAGLALTIAGLAFSVWARLYLGTNWSASVQIKTDHQLVRSGPYRFVRHPIYTGILTGFFGSALALDQWRGLFAFLIVLIALVYKLRLEERWMAETFGDAYADYRRHTGALVPYLF